MEKTSEIEKLKLDIASIDEFLDSSKTYIADARHNITDIEKEENSLRLLYVDVCELDEIREKIESARKMQEDMGDDKDNRDILDQRIQSLQKGLDLVLERLGKKGIRSRDDYNSMMEDVRVKKESIPNTQAEIKKKEQEIVELEERKNTILARIEYLEKDEGNEEIQSSVEKSLNIDANEKLLSQRTKQEHVVSELAAFIDYQNDDEDNKENIVDKPKDVKKETALNKKDSLDSVIEDVLRRQEKVQNKFLEIIQENKEEEISEEIQKFHNKFLDVVYKRLNEAVGKIIDKRKLINKLSEYANEYTKEMEDKRLADLNNDILNSIKSIEQEEQGFEGEIKYSFNEFSEYVNNEFNYLCTLRSRIEDQLTDIGAKIDNIENELGDIKGNTKESILELINTNQKTIDNTYIKLKNVDSLLRENVLMLMDNIKERMNATEDHDEIKAILESFRNDIIAKEEESDSNKRDIEEEINRLNEEKKALEERYNKKKDDETSDIEREAFLLDSKKMLKDEVQKVEDMIEMLNTKNNEFRAKLDEDKRKIKDRIKKCDGDIVTKKKALIDSISEEMKSYKLRLFENVCEYNNEDTKEFDRYATKIMSDIDDLKEENDVIRKKVHNVVVSSEFEENIPLFDALKESLNKIISVNKLVESVEKPEDMDMTTIEQTIKTSLSYIKPENTINDKIDFSSIYDIENNMQMVDELNKSITSIYDRLEMERNIKEKKEKPAKRLYEKDKSRDNVTGLEGYDDSKREVLMDVSWEYIEELKNLNIVYKKSLYIEDLNSLKEEKVIAIAKLKEDYQNALEVTRKLYELKKYVLAYKKGMEELAKGAKSNDKDDQKEYNKFMKFATKSLKTMQENGISSFEDFRSKVMKNSDHVKEILAKTKAENEELVKLTSLIKAIEIAIDEHKEDVVAMV